MVLISRRIHFFEIHEQEWFPDYLREKVQSCLTLFWTIKFPVIQEASAAQSVARILSRVVGDKIQQFTYVDFCAGAGGPTPTIEKEINSKLISGANENSHNSQSTEKTKSNSPVQFVLTDLHPHIPDWTKIAKRNENITFYSEPVDATDVPVSLIGNNHKKIFRLYNLSFHHFDDKLGSDILHNTLETADGFGIFELQDRTISSLFTIMNLGLLLFLITPFYFWKSPGHLFFTYIIPIIPLVVVVDGYTSSLRTRSSAEVLALMNGRDTTVDNWVFHSGKVRHAWPSGYLSWVIGIKK
ncbi:hypothetical protein GcM3_139012 [Golovinomyces cichoracearum]|uniref:Uncharacterized protein n=1 Tax=Golovinomyces cichoracearum TaxID=62708 RepID=A0A420I1B9_9PEZI|nr:hypothetical protein GcM3_139012 [Golovinomyces cichoracearum]